MSDHSWVEIGPLDSYVTTQPGLRFIERDGNKVLQYAEKRVYTGREEFVWVDVPLVQELKAVNMITPDESQFSTYPSKP